MASTIKPYEEISPLLGKSKTAWENLVGFIRAYYVMDELWDAGKPDSLLYQQYSAFRYAFS